MMILIQKGKNLVVFSVLALCLVFSSLTQAEDLTGWNGQWISAISLLNKAEFDNQLQSAYATMGKRDSISGQEWKEKKLAKWNTSIKGVTINGDAITFTLQDGNQVTGHYSYAGSYNMDYSGTTLQWSKFTTDDEGAWHFIMLMKPEISEDHSGLTHFHFRYGNESFDALQTAQVFPTMVAPDTTAEQFAADFAE